jgi:hypothetical protein
MTVYCMTAAVRTNFSMVCSELTLRLKGNCEG